MIVGPTAPSAAFQIGAKTDDPVQMYLNDIFTIAANLTGAPAISIPCGFDRSGLPIGLQLQGTYFAEAKILDVAHRFQQATDWHRQDRLAGCGAMSLGSRHRARDARAALDRVEDLLGRVDRVRRGAEHAGLRGRHRAARRAAGAEPRRGRARDPLRPRRRRDDQPAQRVRAQELLLPRPAEGLPDLAVRDSRRAGRLAHDRRRRTARRSCASRARTSRKTRARACTRTYHGMTRHRPQPRRHAAARDRLRARHAQRRRGGRLREGAARARPLDRHLRRQHAGRKLPLRRQRVGAPPGRRRSARAARSRTSTASASCSRRSTSRCGARSS